MTHEQAPVGEQVQRERLHDNTIADLLGAVGNSELKSVVIGVMEPGREYAKETLFRHVARTQDKASGWEFAWGLPYQYCETTFLPVGLVVKTQVPYEDRVVDRFVITKQGVDAKAFGGLLLDFSLGEKKALVDFLGGSKRKKEAEDEKIGVARRYKMLFELVTAEKPLRITDIAIRAGLPMERVVAHFDDLLVKGIVSFDRRQPNKPVSYFRFAHFPAEGAVLYKNYPTLAKAIMQVVASDPERYWSIRDVETEVQKILGYEDRSNYIRISSILSALAKEKIFQRKKFAWDLQSEIVLTDEQRDPLVKLVGLIDAFQDQQPAVIAFGQQRMREILADRESVSFLLRKAREASSFTNKVSAEKMEAYLFMVLADMPNATTHEISQELQERFEISPKLGYLAAILGKYVKKDLVEKNRDGKVMRWKLKEINRLSNPVVV